MIKRYDQLSVGDVVRISIVDSYMDATVTAIRDGEVYFMRPRMTLSTRGEWVTGTECWSYPITKERSLEVVA